jgi:hypothetical protein
MQGVQDKLSNDLPRPPEKSHKSCMQTPRCFGQTRKKARHDHFACTLPLSQRTHAKMARMRNAEHLSAHCSADATVNASRTKHTQDQCKRCSVSSVILKSRCALTKYIKLRFFAILQTLIPHRISTEQSSRKSYNNTECHHYHAKPCAN